MRRKDGFVLREIADLWLAVPVMDRAKDVQGLIALNETGKFLWALVEQDTDEDALARALMDAFEVDEETAIRDVHAFCANLREQEWLDERKA